AVGLEQDFGAVRGPPRVGVPLAGAGDLAGRGLAVGCGDPDVGLRLVGVDVHDLGDLVGDELAVRGDLRVGDPLELEQVVGGHRPLRVGGGGVRGDGGQNGD